MNETWRGRLTQIFRESLGVLTPESKVNRVNEIEVGVFRMLFASDLYPEKLRMRDLNSLPSDAGGGGDDDDYGDEDDDNKKRKRISEAGRRTEQFLLTSANLIIPHVLSTFDRDRKIVAPDWSKRGEYVGQDMESLLQVSEEAQSLEEIMLDLKEILKLNLQTGHPRVFNNSSGGVDVVSLAGEWLTATANTNMFTYEIAPVFILIEDIILTKMRSLVGWTESCGDGIFAPGGAISNMYALAVARHKLIPESKTKGMSNCPHLNMFVTAQCSSSVIRSAVVLGIGLKNIIFVDCNARGQMMAYDLEAKINRSKSEGAWPFFVSTNGGSAMLGSFDVLTEIADVCERHNVWMHVDASHGGSVLLSKDHCHLLRGIRRAHSVTWNCHSMLGVMLECSAILIREKGLLEACNSACASYLFQQDKHYDVAYDTGDKAIQCGRHNDVFKLWLVWRARGDEGMARHVERLFYLARHFTDLLTNADGFHLVLPEFDFLTICFWYVPEMMRDEKRDDVMEKLSQLTQTVAQKINIEGNCLIGYFNPSQQKVTEKKNQSKKGRKLKITDLTLLSINDDEIPTFFKVVFNNPATDAKDLHAVMGEIKLIKQLFRDACIVLVVVVI